MNKNNPRGRTPSLLSGSNGKPRKVVVERKSECARCTGVINMGDSCVGIPQRVGGFSKVKRFCLSCYKAVLEQTHLDLKEAETLLDQGQQPAQE